MKRVVGSWSALLFLVACSGNDAHVVDHRTPGGASSPPGQTPVDPGAPAGGGGGSGTGAPAAPPPPAAPDGPWPGSNVIFLPWPQQRSLSNPSWGAMLNDLVQHVPTIYGNQYDEPSDPIAWGQIATIGIDGHLRTYVNPYGASGKNAVGVYVTKDRMAFVLEPAIKLAKVLPYVPPSLRGALFADSMQNATQDWNDTPTYVLDEWTTYVNAAEVAVELGTSGAWTAPRSGAVDGALEFTIYVLALVQAVDDLAGATYADTTQLHEFVAWNAERALGLYAAGAALPVFASSSGAALAAGWKSNADAAGLRNFARKIYGGKYCTKVLGITPATE